MFLRTIVYIIPHQRNYRQCKERPNWLSYDHSQYVPKGSKIKPSQITQGTEKKVAWPCRTKICALSFLVLFFLIQN